MSLRKQLASLVTASWLLCLPLQAAEPEATPAEQEIIGRANELLRRYGAKDQEGVVAMMDKTFVVLGSDLKTDARNPAELRHLMTKDFSQWGTVSLGDIRDVSVRIGGDLATAYSLFTFSAEQGAPQPVRLCTTWHKVDGKWLLTQSASSVAPPN